MVMRCDTRFGVIAQRSSRLFTERTRGYTGGVKTLRWPTPNHPGNTPHLLCVVALAFGLSCKKSADPKAESETTQAAQPVQPAATKPAAPAAQAPVPAFKPLVWDDPKSWTRVKPSSPMRHASYEIPPAKGDKDKGELKVFILPGDIEPNIERWVNEFKGVDAKDIVRVERKANGLGQTVVEIASGTFSGGMATLEVGKNFGLLGAIVVTSPDPAAVTTADRKYFFKMTGPSATLASARDAFYAMLDSVKPQAPGEGATASPAATDGHSPHGSQAGTATPKH
jgi:hypothetical protein